MASKQLQQIDSLKTALIRMITTYQVAATMLDKIAKMEECGQPDCTDKDPKCAHRMATKAGALIDKFLDRPNDEANEIIQEVYSKIRSELYHN